MTTLKITHYLNKKLKPLDNGLNELFYPVYVRILFGTEVFRIKSPSFDSGDKWQDYKDNESFNSEDTQNIIKYESDLLKYIYSEYKSFKGRSLNDIVKAFKCNFIDEILKTELYLSTFLEEFISEFSIFLQLKTGIDKNYFTENLNANNIRSYEFLITKFPTENKILNFHFTLIMSFIEFERKNFNDAKPLNVFEWYFKNGKENYLTTFNKELINHSTFSVVMDTIEYFCKGKIFGFEMENKQI